MQFIANGPDIPDSLLQAHEEGRVVFFCGAGISYPAGLPGFKGLVDDVYKRVGISRLAIEQDAYDRNQFDATLDLLERRLPGNRIAVRQKLMEALKPNWRRKGATDTHDALLELARCRDGSLRLVTTNFDRIFERVGKRPGKAFEPYAAPMLPIPKNSRWNGLVYLHGLLPLKPDDTSLHRLVLTSGDFGLAYLTERWAARFVGELFRNYIVCFVGYSINDPVLRYMMDALAADRLLGEFTPQAYAFGDYETGHEHAKTVEWAAKGVTPILYEVRAGSHSALHDTLKSWAATYRGGTLGKEQIVVAHALARPSGSTRQDDFVGRMLWALSDESGMPAKRFADFNPVPTLEWLEAFSDQRYLHRDLPRFGVPPRQDVDDKLRFSLIQRPAPYRYAPLMTLVSGGAGGSQWDDVMFHLARWLARHLNDPGLILWVAQRGGQLHERWAWQIEHQLNHFAQLLREGRIAELDDIRAQSPNAIPGPLLQIVWRLLLTGHVKATWRDLDFYRWKDRLKRDGLTTALRLQLRELLSPKVKLKKPFRWGSEEDAGEPTSIKQLVDWELVLAADHVRSSIRDLTDDQWRGALPTLLDDLQQLLRDALDLLRELGEADDRDDRSFWDLPSVTPHWQNRGFRDWVILIELLRDAWVEAYKSTPDRARSTAAAWFNIPYPTFKRLALFAASHNDAVDSETWVRWLVSDDQWWLWSGGTKRETMRLLVLQGSTLSPEARETLETAILAGPPRKMYREGLAPEDWDSIVEDAIWLRLAKLREGGSALGQDASLRLDSLTVAEPRRRLASNERDEFSHWMSGTGDPDFESRRRIDIAPRKRADLVQWLKHAQPKTSSLYDEDTWLDVCRTRFFHSLLALCDLANEGIWPVARWREALQAWSDANLLSRSWRYGAPLVQRMPDETMREISHSLTWWMRAVSKSAAPHEGILLDLCKRSLAMPSNSDADGKDPGNEPVTDAINHPVGHVAEALLDLWFERKPNDNEGLPHDIEPLFTAMCEVGVVRFRHGRVLLASRLIALFRVDRPWTEKYLLPHFDWDRNPIEARSAWEGFLWSPRLYRPLLIAFKRQFLSTAHHFESLGDHGRQYAAFLTYAALDPADGYTSEDFQDAVGALPAEGLLEVVQALTQALGGAGAQREDYWKNRIQPFWQQIWPKSRDLASGSISESLAIMCVAGEDIFPSVLAVVADWLGPIEHPHYAVHRLHTTGLCTRFPEAALRLLAAILSDQFWAPTDLRDCLDAIGQAKPSLRSDYRYQRLTEYARRRNH
ncbi:MULTISPECIES: anti-phage defense-associated sirtuin Dsr1 [Bradyrhizobium]|uniref:SIR2-like domain-containing protein n=1 Tax=Bradyrhizobium yuanmingense TaxID=108015 RepID=A0A1C3UCU5_9BRAD|nr:MULTISPECIES: anti-phage defense-associated sirtuin Dsr1 [Bradyrhizobium]MCA1379830.1 SIR2 family protein [Bradyrhizobium sp. BRP05]MCA1420156.1 SIR2 family protein [Bradyrhizobium sp. BRP23]TWI20839.1 SIR2-like protein [Bradyrhizobium yuanmingense]SCB13346.1 SIR2-like domain-containing protein [Bradyrhizobium yuanmingense]